MIPIHRLTTTRDYGYDKACKSLEGFMSGHHMSFAFLCNAADEEAERLIENKDTLIKEWEDRSSSGEKNLLPVDMWIKCAEEWIKCSKEL